MLEYWVVSLGTGSSLNTSEFSVIVVTKPISIANPSYIAVISNRESAFKGWVLYLAPISTTNYVRHWMGSGSVWVGQNSWYAAVAGRAEIITTTYSNPISGTNNYNMYFTTSPYTIGTEITTYVPQSSKELRIGAGANDSATPNYYYNGYIAELIIFSRKIKSEERLVIEEYLEKKWGL